MAGFNTSDDELDNDFTDGYAGDENEQPNPGSEQPNPGSEQKEERGYDGDPDDNENEEQEEERAPAGSINPADPIVDLYSALGLEDGLFEFNDQQVRFHELPAEDRAAAAAALLDQVREEGRTAALNSEFGLAADEVDLLNHYRTTGTVQGFEIGADVAALTTEQLHQRDIAARFSTLTPEQQEAELEHRRTSPTFEAQAAVIRGELTQQEQAAAVQRQRDETLAFHQELREGLAPLPDDFHGYQFGDEEKGYAFSLLTTVDQQTGENPFLASLRDPGTLAQVAFAYHQLPNIVADLRQQITQAYVNGKRDALGHNAPHTPQNQGAAPAGNGRRGSQDEYNDDTFGDSPYAGR